MPGIGYTGHLGLHGQQYSGGRILRAAPSGTGLNVYRPMNAEADRPAVTLQRCGRSNALPENKGFLAFSRAPAVYYD